jgi:hypothetical protein
MPPLAYIMWIEGGRPDNSLPGGPPLYPSHGLPMPMPPVDPGYGRPGWSPVDPGYGRPDWAPGHPSGGFPIAPGHPSGGFPIAPGHPSGGFPIAPGRPDAGFPVYPSGQPLPPGLGGGYPDAGFPVYPGGGPMPGGGGDRPIAGQLPTAPPGWLFVYVPGFGWSWVQLAPPAENKPVEPAEPKA